jgi:hypothetical protein
VCWFNLFKENIFERKVLEGETGDAMYRISQNKVNTKYTNL